MTQYFDAPADYGLQSKEHMNPAIVPAIVPF